MGGASVLAFISATLTVDYPPTWVRAYCSVLTAVLWVVGLNLSMLGNAWSPVDIADRM